MKSKITYIVLTIFICSGLNIFAQKDSIAQQRKARKFVRDGNTLYKEKKFTDASVAYKKALSNSSYYDKASYNLGNALYQGQNFKEAIPQFELTAKTAEDKYTKAEAYHNMGNAFMETKNYQGAVDAYKNSLRNNPNDDETRYNLAVAQKLLDKQNQQNKDKNKNNKDNKNKDKKDKDDKNKNDDKKDGDDKDKKDDKNKDDKGNKNQDDKNKPNKNDKKDEKQKPKPNQGKMSPQQIKQLLESLNNEEKKTQKKMNAKKAKGKKTKQEKDW